MSSHWLLQPARTSECRRSRPMLCRTIAPRSPPVPPLKIPCTAPAQSQSPASVSNTSLPPRSCACICTTTASCCCVCATEKERSDDSNGVQVYTKYYNCVSVGSIKASPRVHPGFLPMRTLHYKRLTGPFVQKAYRNCVGSCC